VPAQPVVDEDMDADDVAAEQERARLQAVADGKAAAASRPAPADEDQLQRQVQDAAPTVIDNFDNVVVKRKVNGVEELVPLADVMRTHQKTAAADQRLEEATRLLREAEARARAVPEVAAPATTPPKDEAADIAAELTTALFAGDEEKARELLRQGLSRPSTPTPAPVPSVALVTKMLRILPSGVQYAQYIDRVAACLVHNKVIRANNNLARALNAAWSKQAWHQGELLDGLQDVIEQTLCCDRVAYLDVADDFCQIDDRLVSPAYRQHLASFSAPARL